MEKIIKAKPIRQRKGNKIEEYIFPQMLHFVRSQLSKRSPFYFYKPVCFIIFSSYIDILIRINSKNNLYIVPYCYKNLYTPILIALGDYNVRKFTISGIRKTEKTSF